ncbi:MAG: hypothetical protein ACOX8U_09060, partial [Bradymonadia bacterium]
MTMKLKLRSIIILLCVFALALSCELQMPVTVEGAGEPCAGAQDFGFCKRHEYCSQDGFCIKAGDSCEESLKNHNGFGYCMAGYACTNGECQLAVSTCSSDLDCEKPLNCVNEIC